MPDNLDADISTYVEYVRIITDSSVNTSVIVYHTAELVSGSLASQRGKLGLARGGQYIGQRRPPLPPALSERDETDGLDVLTTTERPGRWGKNDLGNSDEVEV